MKLALQYLSDSNGKPQAVQLSLTDWEKVLTKLRKYEQAFKIKTDLMEAIDEVSLLKSSKKKNKL